MGLMLRLFGCSLNVWWIHLVIYVSRFVSLLNCLVCFLQSCDYLLGKSWHLGSIVCEFFLCFCHFPILCLGQVWYLFVSIPILCLLLSAKKRQRGNTPEYNPLIQNHKRMDRIYPITNYRSNNVTSMMV